MAAIIHRQVLANEWSKWFIGFNHGYWITLNSKIEVAGLSDYRVPSRVTNLGTKIGQYLEHLNEFCFGRKYIRSEQNAKLQTLVGYEVGSDTGMIHAHIIAAHTGNTTRSIQQVKDFSIRKWSKQYKI